MWGVPRMNHGEEERDQSGRPRAAAGPSHSSPPQEPLNNSPGSRGDAAYSVGAGPETTLRKPYPEASGDAPVPPRRRASARPRRVFSTFPAMSIPTGGLAALLVVASLALSSCGGDDASVTDHHHRLPRRQRETTATQTVAAETTPARRPRSRRRRPRRPKPAQTTTQKTQTTAPKPKPAANQAVVRPCPSVDVGVARRRRRRDLRAHHEHLEDRLRDGRPSSSSSGAARRSAPARRCSRSAGAAAGTPAARAAAACRSSWSSRRAEPVGSRPVKPTSRLAQVRYETVIRAP